VAERALPLLKKKTNIGTKEVQQALEEKYNIKIFYQNVWMGRHRGFLVSRMIHLISCIGLRM
jgi:transposase